MSPTERAMMPTSVEGLGVDPHAGGWNKPKLGLNPTTPQ
jgi:hypothetical protein